MANRWVNLDGDPGPPQAVYYRIIEPGGNVAVHETLYLADPMTRRYHRSLAVQDQWFADAIVALIQRTCRYFFDPDYIPLPGVADIVISDADVEERIYRIEHGENQREAVRTGKSFYPLHELPGDQQRALIEQIERLKREARFEWIGETL